jgi:hypothetical protein
MTRWCLENFEERKVWGGGGYQGQTEAIKGPLRMPGT